MADVEPGSVSAIAAVAEIRLSGPGELDRLLRESAEPFVVRGLVEQWPLVRAGRESSARARDYLLAKSRDVGFTVSIGEPGSKGRIFYDQAMGMNFRTLRLPLREIFERMEESEGRPERPAIYLGSIDVHDFFLGLHEENHLDLAGRNCLESIWIGTPTRVAAHNDFPDNLACVAVGRRRFTLFPPDQFRNLYLGPLDNTPAGRPVSMVDLHAPDFTAFPKFREALRHAQLAELGPGDAIFIPSSWWHHVEALDPFNVLVNYWWRDTPRWLGQPQDALHHAILALRDLPEDEKRHWRAMFDYYVFENDEEVVAHIPEQARGVLAPLTAETAGPLRAHLLRALSG